MKCEDCDTTDNVGWTTCPYAEDVHEKIIEVVLCANCRRERAMDI